MICGISGCLHVGRYLTTRSWQELQICHCCAVNLHTLNSDEPIFSKFKQFSVRCREIGNGVYTGNRNRIFEIVIKKPSTTAQIIEECIKLGMNRNSNYIRTEIYNLRDKGKFQKRGSTWYAVVQVQVQT